MVDCHRHCRTEVNICSISRQVASTSTGERRDSPAGRDLSDTELVIVEDKQVARRISGNCQRTVEHGLRTLPVHIAGKAGTGEGLHDVIIGVVDLGFGLPPTQHEPQRAQVQYSFHKHKQVVHFLGTFCSLQASLLRKTSRNSGIYFSQRLIVAELSASGGSPWLSGSPSAAHNPLNIRSIRYARRPRSLIKSATRTK